MNQTKMQKVKQLLWGAFAVVLLSPSAVFAAGETQSTGCDPRTQLCNPIKYDSIDTLLSAAMDIVLQLGTVIAILFFIYAGYKYITARGSEDKIKEAHKVFLNTAIGTAILLGAKLIAVAIASTISKLQ